MLETVLQELALFVKADVSLTVPNGLSLYLAKNERQPAHMAMAYWGRQKKLITPEWMKRAISENGVPLELETSLNKETRLFVTRDLKTAWERAADSASSAIMSRISRLPKKTFIEKINQWIISHSAALIVQISIKQSASLQALIHHQVVWTGITSPYLLAERIRPIVGLHEKWAMAVERRRAILLAEGLSVDKVGKQTLRYAEFLHKTRAMNIARTELQHAYLEGQLGSLRQASQEGEIVGKIEKIWIAAGGERTCEWCAGMDGETVDIDQPFSCGADRPPHPNHPVDCRCDLGYRVRR